MSCTPRRRVLAGAAALALLIGDCATAAPLEGDGASAGASGGSSPLIVQPPIAVPDLIRLTPGQVRERFGLPPADSENVIAARLDGDALITVVTFAGVGAAGGCSNGGHGWLGDVESLGAERARFVFRDSQLAEMQPSRAMGGLSPVGEVVLNCYLDQRPSEFDAITFVVVVPFLPFLAVQMNKEKKQRQAAIATLAALRLGAPPPGGLAAYAAAPPPQAAVTATGEDAAEILITVKETGFEARASVRDGRVVAVVAPPYTTCALGEDRALHC